MKKLFTILLFFVYLVVNSATYYVKAAGGTGTGLDDPNAWSFAHFLTRTFSSGDIVYFKRGDTFTSTIVPQSNVTYDAYGSGNKPIISGLTTISSWTNLGGGLYEKTLASPPTNSLNMVLFDGALQPIGRTPKANLGDASYYYLQSFSVSSPSWTNSSGVLTSNGISGIPSFVGGEMVQRTQSWIFDRGTVTAQTGTTVSYNSHVSPDHPTVSYSPVNGHGFFFQNHINCLTVLGDWAYNQTTKKITMYFGAENPTIHTIEVATIDGLCTITSKTNIVIRNIYFKGCNENAINLSTVTNCTLNNVDIGFVGINGIDVGGTVANTNNNTVDSCNINNVNNNGANLYASPNWYFNNSIVRRIGLRAGMGKSGDGQYIGVFQIGSNSIAEYNAVDSMGYLGISFVGNNTIIRYNHIYNYCLEKSDGGAIYTYGNTGTGRYINNNIVHDGIGNRYGMGTVHDIFEGNIHGIYLDQFTTGVTVADNTSFRNEHSGILLTSGSGTIVTGNTLYDNQRTQLITADVTGIVKQNIFFAKRMQSMCLHFQTNPTTFGSLTMDSNFMCHPIWEPQGINSTGYSTIPFLSTVNYHDGGIVLGFDNKFKSLDVWKTYSGKDAATVLTPFLSNTSATYPASLADTAKIQIEYNATKSMVTIPLAYSCMDVRGNIYNSTITLCPYASAVLIRIN